jgi:hypothetical protein
MRFLFKKGTITNNESHVKRSESNNRGMSENGRKFKGKKVTYNLDSPVHKTSKPRTKMEYYSAKYRKLRKIIYLILEEPESTGMAVKINFLLQLCILSSTVIVILDSVGQFSEDDNYDFYSMILEEALLIVFSLELFLRLTCCTAFGESRSRYMKRPVLWIDIASVLPFFVEIFTSASVSQLRVFRIVRFTRILRLFKISRYLKRIYVLTEGVKRSANSFGFLFLALVISNIFWATCYHFSEFDGNKYVTSILFHLHPRNR